MTIRNRVTLWNVGALLFSLLIIAGGLYFELVYERKLTKSQGLEVEPVKEELAEVIFYYTVPALLVALVGGWWLLRRALSPLHQLMLAAERINAENLRDPLPRTGNGDEVDRLSEVLNAMNRRVADAVNEVHEFTLHASHELKTPLTILHSQIETALEAPALAENQRARLADQLDEIQRLARIVEGLNLLARANTGQMAFAREPVPLHELVQEAAEDAVVLAHARKIKVSLGENDPATVIGDRHRLRQALLNLTENAVKYNHDGGAITMNLRTVGDRVEFAIANTGPGIRPEEAPHVFDKFFRGTAGYAVEAPGIGLGLSIVQRIVRAHPGASIELKSQPEWTTFRISFPKAIGSTSNK